MAVRYDVVEAKPLDLFMGVCEKCVRPRREENWGLYPLTEWADKHNAECSECNGVVKMQRVYGVEIEMDCDYRCMGATGSDCECQCGGQNHGGIWSEKGEMLTLALEQYRETAAKRKENAMATKERTRQRRVGEYKEWVASSPEITELVQFLRAYWTDNGGYPNRFLDSLIEERLMQFRPLSDAQLEAGLRTMRRRKWSQDKSAASPAKATTNAAPRKREGKLAAIGVYRLVAGDPRGPEGVYLVRQSKQNPERHLAVRLVDSPPRMTESGMKVRFEGERAVGMVYRLTEDDRMPDAELADFMVKYGQCVNCFHGLKAEKSLRRITPAGMMGPTCARRLGYLPPRKSRKVTAA